MKIMAILLLLTAQSAAWAESKITHGNYELHFTTLPSTFLPKEVTTSNQIKRSKSRGVLSISILDTRTQPAKATAAEVKVTAKNLLGQSKDIEIKHVNEGDEAVYYLALYRINNQENVHFSIEAKPQGSKQWIKHEFTREFFTD